MPDRVKESIFNVLASRFGCCGTLPPLDVVDLFAGSGSLGLEALSRGVASCCFVETGRDALSVLRQNIEALDAGDRSRVVEADAWSSASALEAARGAGLLFLDPPYADSEDATPQGLVACYLRDICTDGDADRVADKVGKGGDKVAVLHHRRKVTFGPDPVGGWQVVDRRSIGSNGVTYFGR